MLIASLGQRDLVLGQRITGGGQLGFLMCECFNLRLTLVGEFGLLITRDAKCDLVLGQCIVSGGEFGLFFSEHVDLGLSLIGQPGLFNQGGVALLHLLLQSGDLLLAGLGCMYLLQTQFRDLAGQSEALYRGGVTLEQQLALRVDGVRVGRYQVVAKPLQPGADIAGPRIAPV